jgi:hypothetical protein
LKMMSQARGARNLAALPGYVYDSRAGTGITVYVIDTGVDLNHLVSVTYPTNTIGLRLTGLQEFEALPGSIRWLYLPNEPQVESDPVGHGTCVASKVVGRALGVAKNVNLVVVKAITTSRTIRASQFISTWAMIGRDIQSAGLSGRAVVTTSMGCEQIVYLNMHLEIRINDPSSQARPVFPERQACLHTRHPRYNQLGRPCGRGVRHNQCQFLFPPTKHSFTIDMTRPFKLTTLFRATLRCL